MGQHSFRAGYGGEDAPKADIPTSMGIWTDYDITDEMDVETSFRTHYNIDVSATHVRKRGNLLLFYMNYI